MKPLLRWLSLGIFLLHFTAAAQTAPPFRIGLNFAFVGTTNTTLAQAFTNIVPLGLRGTRHSTPADVNWTALQTRSNVPPSFTNADQVFFNSNGLAVLGTLFDDPNPSTSTGLQVPWITGSGFNFTSNELYYASNYVRTVVSRYAGVSHYWEISNEVDGQTNRPRSLPPSEFASFLITNRNWIRAVDPQAQVVLPGCLGNYAASCKNGQLITTTCGSGTWCVGGACLAKGCGDHDSRQADSTTPVYSQPVAGLQAPLHGHATK